MKRKRTPARLYPGRLSYCPQCRHKLNTCVDFAVSNSTPPAPGDATICGYCRAVLMYNADLSLRLATPAEKLEILIMFEDRPAVRFATKEINIVGIPGYHGPEESPPPIPRET